MASFKTFEEIESWQMARELDKIIFQKTKEQEFSRDFKLRDQILGSSVSIMDNIAEGFERAGNREFVQFLSIAKGSCGEFRSQLYRAMDRGYIDQNDFDGMYESAINISKKIGGLMNYLAGSEYKGTKFIKRNVDSK